MSALFAFETSPLCGYCDRAVGAKRGGQPDTCNRCEWLLGGVRNVAEHRAVLHAHGPAGRRRRRQTRR